MKLGLVLGGGGLIGLGYHAGVLRALADRGVDVGRADVIVGTSAGAIVAAYLGAGWLQTDFFEYAHGRHPNAVRDGVGKTTAPGPLFSPMWGSTGERLRRGIGSAFTMASSRGLWKAGGRIPAPFLRRLFPSGMYSSDDTGTRFHTDLPREWPRPGIVLCAAELYTGRRVGFGMPGAPPAVLPDAVLASTAIPGVFPPVRIGAHHYVDGGVVSGTSLDFAAGQGCDSILCIAPLGYRADISMPIFSPRKWSPVLVRAPFARVLRREVVAARSEGKSVLVIRPWTSDLAAHGTNSMRNHNRGELADGARIGTNRLLESVDGHPVLSAFGTGRESPLSFDG
jgi:NTE family protein